MTQRNTANPTTKLAIVTGGSRGLGRSMVLSLARRGVDSIFTYHSNRAEAEKVIGLVADAGRKAVALQLDTGDVRAFDPFVQRVRQALAELGAERFDYLVNNAGTSLHKAFVQTTEEELDRLYNVHFKGVFFLTQKLLPLLGDGGRIVNISSGLARFSIPGSSAYASMKGAVEVLTRYLAKELGPRGIVVNTVAPGAIETDFSGGMVRDNPEVNRQVANMTALGRVGQPDDIAGIAVFLASRASTYITGAVIPVDGGISVIR
jgi:NAD(P)-dependent dehydrogenase (short-subunit alcohol dehydrogenase family)